MFIFSFHAVLCCTRNLLLQAAKETGDGSHDNSSDQASKNKQQIPTSHLIEVMQYLTLNPGKFDDLITPLVDTFSDWLGDEEKVSFVVKAIVEQVSCN
jgi:hypothetical protein